MEDRRRSEFVRSAFVLLLIVGLALLVVPLAPVLLLVFAAAVIASLLRTIADPLASRGMPDKLAVALTVLVVAGVIGLTGLLFGTTIADQFEDIARRLPRAIDALRSEVRDLTFGKRLSDELDSFAPSGNDVAGRITGMAGTAIGGVLNVVVVFVGGIYFAAAPSRYAKGIARLFPDSDRRRVYEALLALAPALRKFLLGQLVTMVIVAVLVGCGLALIGAPAPVALGLIAGLLNFIPFFGAFLGAVPGILLTLAVDPSLALYAAGIYFVVQQVEGDAISPLIQKRAVDLPPALLVFSVLGMGLLFGPLGVILAAPLTVVVFTLVVVLYSRNTLGNDVKLPGQ